MFDDENNQELIDHKLIINKTLAQQFQNSYDLSVIESKLIQELKKIYDLQHANIGDQAIKIKCEDDLGSLKQYVDIYKSISLCLNKTSSNNDNLKDLLFPIDERDATTTIKTTQFLSFNDEEEEE